MTVTKYDVVMRIRVLLSVNWCRGAFARNARGASTNSLGDDAVQFCLAGAFNRSSQLLHPGETWMDLVLKDKCIFLDQKVAVEKLITKKINKYHGHECMVHFNDNCSSNKPIIALLDEILEDLRREALPS